MESSLTIRQLTKKQVRQPVSKQKNMTQKEAVDICKKTFAKAEGQENAKARLTQNILSALVDGYLVPILFIATYGLGKTLLLKLYASCIRQVLGREILGFASGADLGTRITFAEDVLIQKFHDKDAVIIVDEIQEARKPVIGLMRSMINPESNRSPVTVRVYGDAEVTADPKRNSFVFATNKIDELDVAFVSRLERIDLAMLTDENMMAIIDRILHDAGITFHDTSKRIIAECNRGTARDVVKWTNAVRQFCAVNAKKTFSIDNAREVIKMRETYPLGVTANELKTLLHLEARGSLKLKELAGLNIVSPKEQNSNETYLLQRGLMAIKNERELTSIGEAYLKELRKHRFALPALPKQVAVIH
jgi:Holliday junction resolvasome RuvABC ATP-dependent DNA helicase subunit